MGKLKWTEGMRVTSDVVSRILQSRLVVDTGEWGTWEWGEHVLGAPGYRIAGGSDEVQRNIIGERVLGIRRHWRSRNGFGSGSRCGCGRNRTAGYTELSVPLLGSRVLRRQGIQPSPLSDLFQAQAPGSLESRQ